MKIKQTLVLGLLLAAILIVPTKVGAQSVCELNLLVCNLNRQILSLQLSDLNQQVALLSQPCGQPKAAFNFLTGQRCLQSDKPTVTVLSPTKGQSYAAGGEMTIRWNSSPVPSVINLTLHRRSDNTVGIRIGEVAMVNDGVEVWEIPENIPMGNDYFVRVNLDVQNPELAHDTVAESGTFTIISMVEESSPLHIDLVSTEEEVSMGEGNIGDTGIYRITFDVEAVDEDIYIDGDTLNVASPNSSTDGMSWAVTSGSSGYTSYDATAILQSNADTYNQSGSTSYRVNDGETERFTLIVHLSPKGSSGSSMVGVKLTGIKWDTDSGDSHANLYNSNLSSLKTDPVSLRNRITSQPAPATTYFYLPNGGIDARKPSGSFSEVHIGTSVSPSSNNYPLSDFSVVSSRTDLPLSISSLTYNTDEKWFIKPTFSRQIMVGERIRVTHKPSNASSCMGYLPGDVDGSGVVAPADHLALIDEVNKISSGAIPASMNKPYATDIDRSGATNAADILALVDGFNQSGWMGKSLPACPSPQALVPGNTQYANTLTSIQAILQQIQSGLSGL